jgi:copper chaperone
VQALILSKERAMTIELTVPAMSCGHCVKTITRAVQRLDPAAQVRPDLATKRVAFDTTLARETLQKALADEGYPAADPR